MKRLRMFPVLLAGLVACMPSRAVAQQDFVKHARNAAAAYRCELANERAEQLKLHDESILRWTNPFQGREARGEVFLWTSGGRPRAVMSIYQLPGPSDSTREHHEFSSLTDVAVSASGPIMWSPKSGGVEFKPLVTNSPPLDTARKRLTQMRDLATGFTVQKKTREGEQQPLRLLTQPVYRYEVAEGDEVAEGKVIDGALFAFVEATDPDAFLLIEAIDTGGSPSWQYAFARMNGGELRAERDAKTVWEAPLLPWSEAVNRKDLPYSAFKVQ